MKVAAYLLLAAFLGLELCLAVPLGKSAANHTCSCKKKSQQFLVGLFNSANNNSNCFNLQTLSTAHPAHGNGTSTVHTPFSILSGCTHCLRQLRKNGECLDNNDFPQCTSTQEIQNTGHGMFPQFELHIACRGCREDDHLCLETQNGTSCYYRENTLWYRPLVRQQRCSQDGYEVWTPTDVQHYREINAACSCVRNNPASSK